jgi:hypothetical protein
MGRDNHRPCITLAGVHYIVGCLTIRLSSTGTTSVGGTCHVAGSTCRFHRTKGCQIAAQLPRQDS